MDFIAAFAAYLEKERRYSPNTSRAYVADLRAMAAFAEERGRPEPQRWSSDLLRAHLARVTAPNGERAKPSTIARKQSALRALFHWLRRDQPDLEDPTVQL